MPLVNGFPIDATGKLLVTTTAPTSAWPQLGGKTYDPLTGALAVIDAVPAATDPWVGAVRFTNIGQMYVWSAAAPAGVEYIGGIPVTDDGRMVVGSGTPLYAVGGLPIGSDGTVPVNGLAAQPIFFAPLTNSLIPTTAGNPTFTFSRATLAYAMDFEGILRQSIANEARFQGARRVRNLAITSSQNATGAGWTRTNVTVTFGALGPTGLADANTVTATAASALCFNAASGFPPIAVTCSLWIRRRTGTGTVTMLKPDGNTGPDITASLADGTWKRYTSFIANSGANAFIGVVIGTSGDALDIAYAQAEQVDGQSNQAPGEYVSVGVLAAPYHGNAIDGVKYFATRNGNSGAATNLVRQSQTFDNATWTKENASIGADLQQAPDGSMTADVFLDDSTNGIHRAYESLPAITVGQPYTFSVYLKSGTLPWAQLVLSDGGGAAWANFNLATGATGNKSANVVTNVTPLPNGWYRCSIVFVVTGAGGSFPIVCGINTNANVVTPTYVGTGQTMYLWGAQLEAGATASLYLPTTTAAVSTNIVTEATGTPIPLATTLGYVAENAATNLQTQSQTFDDATATGWTKNDATAVNDATVAAPDGTLTADKYTDSATNAFHRIFGPVISLTSQPITFSVYAKAGTLTWMQLVGTGGLWANFNLVTGALGNKHASATSSIVALPNGWYRCIISATGTNFNAQIVSLPSDINALTPSYVGTGQTMYLWGAQVEASSDPSSYIPTTTVAVVRNKDDLSYPAATNLSGSLATTYSETYMPTQQVVTFRVALGWDAANVPQYYNGSRLTLVTAAGTAQAVNAIAIGAVNKNATAWSGATASAVLNGGAVGAGAFTALPGAPAVTVGGSSAGNLQGTIRNVKFYNVRIADADLITMTA